MFEVFNKYLIKIYSLQTYLFLISISGLKVWKGVNNLYANYVICLTIVIVLFKVMRTILVYK